MGFCSICLEDDVELVFSCPKKSCEYELCAPCVKFALEDAEGGNSRACPSCRAATARPMVESLCGRGATRAIERELRPKVEFEVQKEFEKREQGKQVMTGMTERARKLFIELSDDLNTQCPRCKMVFHDYDGCNALKCGNSGCGAAFCAICLKDCGNDAHAHVRESHRTLFDKEAFYRAKVERERIKLNAFMKRIEEEPFEVRELVRIEYDKLSNVSTRGASARRGVEFLKAAKQDLTSAVRNDRLSLLSNGDTVSGKRFCLEDVSPRNAIPEEYHLRLHHKESTKCVLKLYRMVNFTLREIALPSEEDDAPKQGDRPKVDALVNIKRSLQCGVIAFEGARQLYQSRTVRLENKSNLGENEVSILLRPIDSRGDTIGGEEPLSRAGNGQLDGRDILGVNQNVRLLKLERHVKESDGQTLLIDPLAHFVGDGTPRRVLNEIPVPAPSSFHDLNSQQQRVAHPLSLATAMEAAGPPGTGKTKTITELVRGILECTAYDVIVLSERNGAIDAIADKVAGDCLRRDSKDKVESVKDIRLWTKVLSFGASGAVGPSTKLFNLHQKIRYHPELVEQRRLVLEKQKLYSQLAKRMLSILGNAIEEMQDVLPGDADEIWKRSRLINSGTESGLERATEILASVQNASRALESLLTRQYTCNDVRNLVLDHSSLLSGLMPIEEPNTPHPTSLVSRSSLRAIAASFKKFLHDKSFSPGEAEKVQLAVRDSEESLRAAEERISLELEQGARVLLCTIGSSHQLAPDTPTPPEEGQSANLNDAFGRLSINMKPTVVVFDEAGCIPSYEFLGLSRLGRNIVSLVCVGDKHQLPPYDPNSSKDMRRGGRYRGGQTQRAESKKVQSLLDASALSIDNTKVKLTTQYRVPRDIANLLNARIYRGDYNTADGCRAPLQGFVFVNVQQSPYRRERQKKYVNEDEIDKCVEIVRGSSRAGNGSVMVLTPYKKQQRQLQFEFEKKGLSSIPVLTIDQCQGQEADVVVISLVQKPTRFLDKNRLNVALSRVRQKLYFLTNLGEFRDASQNKKWGCSHLAKDLLAMAGDESESDDDVYF